VIALAVSRVPANMAMPPAGTSTVRVLLAAAPPAEKSLSEGVALARLVIVQTPIAERLQAPLQVPAIVTAAPGVKDRDMNATPEKSPLPEP
jgi:hypothetical protein